MNSKEHKELKKKAIQRYETALDMAEKQKVAELSAIETVWRMSHPSRKRKNQKSDSNNLHPADLNASSYGALSNAVKEALQYVPDTFTKKHIREALNQIAPDVAVRCKESSLTGRLIRLANEGIIRQTRAGKGSSPSEYTVVEQQLKPRNGVHNKEAVDF